LLQTYTYFDLLRMYCKSLVGLVYGV